MGFSARNVKIDVKEKERECVIRGFDDGVDED
jgi:hypothetical protein